MEQYLDTGYMTDAFSCMYNARCDPTAVNLLGFSFGLCCASSNFISCATPTLVSSFKRLFGTYVCLKSRYTSGRYESGETLRSVVEHDRYEILFRAVKALDA